MQSVLPILARVSHLTHHTAGTTNSVLTTRHSIVSVPAGGVFLLVYDIALA